MKSWSFKTENNPNEISEKLKSVLGPANGFVFNIERYDNNSITFKIRKRILYGWYLAFHNWTVINGKLLRIDAEKNTTVKISFTHHFIIKLIIIIHFFLGLVMLISIILRISSNASMYVLGGIILALGIILWIAIQKKFQKDIQKYKSLISEILEL